MTKRFGPRDQTSSFLQDLINIMQTRLEKDFLGTLEVPENVYWGIHTERAIRNFPISGYRVHASLIKALALVKKACCQANLETGHLASEIAEAVAAACNEIAAGALSDQFPIDAMQGGAGTSTNMNVNEVVANRAIEIKGGTKGDYSLIHPLEDVNLHQSTNDAYPTAVRVAGIYGLQRLSGAIADMQGVLQEKEKVFANIVKIGRTELQDAVPVTLGAEFSAFAEAFARDRWRTFKCEERLRVVNLGGAAVGTGLAAPRDYIFLVIEKLRDVTGLGLARGENLMGETANADTFVEVSGILKAHAVNLIKMANDLRILNFIGEIQLPALQAGSSIMPGKVNPVMLEAAVQVGIKVMANDQIISDVACRGSLQINEFLPLLAHALLESLDLLARINRRLAEYIGDITANETVCRAGFDHSPMIVTALLPVIGYDRATDLIQEFHRSGETNITRFLENQLGEELVKKMFSPYQLTALGYRKDGSDAKGK
jgi:aspartate ammonia-lyase